MYLRSRPSYFGSSRPATSIFRCNPVTRIGLLSMETRTSPSRSQEYPPTQDSALKQPGHGTRLVKTSEDQYVRPDSNSSISSSDDQNRSPKPNIQTLPSTLHHHSPLKPDFNRVRWPIGEQRIALPVRLSLARPSGRQSTITDGHAYTRTTHQEAFPLRSQSRPFASLSC